MEPEIDPNKMTLALETAVGSGSLAVFRGMTLLADLGDESSQPARAEQLLISTKALLDRAGAALSNIGMVAVSVGPGSYSGIRIGLATAIGLKNALNVEFRGVSLLEAIAFSRSRETAVVAAVPVGKNDVASQTFETTAGRLASCEKPRLTSIAEFLDITGKRNDSTVVAPRKLVERFDAEHPGNYQVADADMNLATLVGIFALANPDATAAQPIYLRSGSNF